MEITWDLQIIHDTAPKMEKEEGIRLPLHSAFTPRPDYSALAATT